MLTCKDFLKELNEYLDETVDVELRQELQRHINECPNCWVIMDTCKKTIHVYKGVEAQTVPDPVRDRLMAALQKRMAEKCRSKNA